MAEQKLSFNICGELRLRLVLLKQVARVTGGLDNRWLWVGGVWLESRGRVLSYASKQMYFPVFSAVLHTPPSPPESRGSILRQLPALATETSK
jgi:hypothetical protein